MTTTSAETRPGRLVIGVLCAGSITACGQAGITEAPSQIGSGLPFAAQFRQSAQCAPLGRYRPPAVGTTYIYAREDGSRSSREILAVDRAIVRFQYRLEASGGRPELPPRTAIAGMFVIHGPSANREIIYFRDPIGVVETLALGETTTIPTVEVSKVRNRERRLEFETSVRFRACGTVSVGGRPVAVRVYDVSTARRVVERSGKDGLRYSGVTYYLSSDTGYPIVFQDTETTTAVSISRP